MTRKKVLVLHHMCFLLRNAFSGRWGDSKGGKSANTESRLTKLVLLEDSGSKEPFISAPSAMSAALRLGKWLPLLFCSSVFFCRNSEGRESRWALCLPLITLCDTAGGPLIAGWGCLFKVIFSL